MWMTPPNSPPGRWAVGGGGTPDLRHPSQRWKVSSPGTPFCHPHSEQRLSARAHAVEPVLGPHDRTDHTRNTRIAVPRPPARENGRSGEGQRLTPDPPHNSGRPPPPGTSPNQARGTQPPQGVQAKPGREEAGPDRPPLSTPDGVRDRGRTRRGAGPFRHPYSKQSRPARAHAVEPVLGPHACTDRTRDTRVAEPRPPAPEGGRPGEGQRLTPDAPDNGGRPPPPGTAPYHPHGMQPPQGMQAKGTVFGPHTHTPTRTACGWRTPTARPVGGQFREGERLTTDAPHNGGRHPPGNALLPPPQQATPARKGARCWAGAGSPRPHRPHPGHTARGTPATRPRGRTAGGGTAPDTRRPSQRWQAGPPPGTPPTTPAARSPHRACRPRGQCWAPTLRCPRTQHVGSGPQQPAQ